MEYTTEKLAAVCQAKVIGGNPQHLITSVSTISDAHEGQITQLTDKRYYQFLKNTKASACLVAESHSLCDVPETMSLLVCKDPEMAFIEITRLLHPQFSPQPTIDERAVLGNDLNLGNNIYIGPYTVISDNVQVGDNTNIYPGAFIGKDVIIGENCTLYPQVVIYDGVQIGSNVILHSGAIIGADGFGYKFRNNEHIKVPQIGTVIIEDNVEIGANTCVDRGASGLTRIGKGTKIDNLVQIGHNDRIGKNVIICGQSGVAGSCDIEDNVILAASAGIADHLTIGKNSIVLARSGVANDVKENQRVFGTPAKERKTAWKELAYLAKTPELHKKIKELEKRIGLLEQQKLIT